MKKILIILLTIVLLFASSVGMHLFFSSTDLSANRNLKTAKTNLVIDAGHGGIDAGTSAADGTQEKVINLAIALKLYDFARVSGINTFLVRDGDYLVYSSEDDRSRSDLYNRMDYVNSIYNSTLISIHQNHFENESEWGMQVWYSPNDDKSKVLADNILNITNRNLQPDNNRLNKQSDSSYYLLYKAEVPSVMVECGFMSNREENELLKDSEYQNNLAYSILLGFSSYLCEEL